ncbi:uncharacterized protein LOC135470208 [Liolophura sinensis]|uniref:uncharacterized protein LOC135470208 n=1 Tax=Liolophura sinensis TaxID=3198878 RepID=UPI0031590EEE
MLVTVTYMILCSLGVTCLSVGTSIWYFQKYQRQQKKRRCVMIMSRYPSPGSTKTRLIPTLGEKGAAVVQLYMTEKILDNISGEAIQNPDVRIELMYSGVSESKMDYWLGKRRQSTQLSWRPQAPGGLGDKLIAAFSTMFREGVHQAVAVGSDIPELDSEIIEEAFSLLLSDDIFKNIDWGSEHVFEQQIEKARHLGVNIGILRRTLSDVDSYDDLPVFEKAIGLSTTQLLHPSLSIIIPVYNEVDNIKETLETIVQHAKFKERLEIIVSDGGSTDGTKSAVGLFAHHNSVPIRVVDCQPGRGPQLMSGASAAKGDNLLFLHADSVVPEDFDETLNECLQVPGNVGGAFAFDVDILYPELWTKSVPLLFSWKMKMIRKLTQLRSCKLELPYGDQGLFMTRWTYDKVGGFDKVYLMEDYIMVEKLKQCGHVVIAPGSPVITSARRWVENGAFKTSLLNLLIATAYHLGVAPNTLARWYYGEKLKKILDEEK